MGGTCCFTEDHSGTIWIGTKGDGLIAAVPETPTSLSYKLIRYMLREDDIYSLSSNDIYCLYEDPLHRLWVATFRAYTTKDGIPSDALLSVAKDRKGNLWFVAEEELCKFAPGTGEIENYNDKTFPERINFNEGTALKTEDGHLLFNTVRGIFHFSPDSIITNMFAPPIIFTSFLQGGQSALPILPKDREFMKKVVETIEENMDNSALMVDDLAAGVNMSRSVFFKKLKTLTGLSPVDFLKEIRMKQAVQLIETGEYSISQISYMVGFDDPHYFSKCFKQQYGITATEYKESMKRQS